MGRKGYVENERQEKAVEGAPFYQSEIPCISDENHRRRMTNTGRCYDCYLERKQQVRGTIARRSKVVDLAAIVVKKEVSTWGDGFPALFKE